MQYKIECFLRRLIRYTTSPSICAIQDALMMTIAMTITGSIFVLLANLPIPHYPELMQSLLGESWKARMLYPVGVTMDLLGIITAVAIGYRLGRRYDIGNGMQTAIVSLSAFLSFLPYQVKSGDALVYNVIPTEFTGPAGLFVAIITSILATKYYRFLIEKNVKVTINHENVPPAVAESFTMVLPTLIIVTSFWLLRLFLEGIGIPSLFTAIGFFTKYITFAIDSFWGKGIEVLISQFLWYFGIRGDYIFDPVVVPALIQNSGENHVAYEAGLPLPHVVAAGFARFVYAGGAGATLGLALIMTFCSRTPYLRNLGRIALPAGIFGINEMLLFSMPVLFNPIMLIPFIFTPFVLHMTTYSVMYWGWVSKPIGIILPWTTPPLISGYLITGCSWQGVALDIFNIFLSALIYLPFLRALENSQAKRGFPYAPATEAELLSDNLGISLEEANRVCENTRQWEREHPKSRWQKIKDFFSLFRSPPKDEDEFRSH